MVAYFPAHNPRYTVLTTIHTKRQAGKSYYGGPLSGPVVKKVVTYLYNREHDWDLSPENSGEKHYPRRIKGGDIAQIRRIADKFSPRTSFEDRKGWGTVRIDSLSNVTISTLAQDDQTMPNVVGMGTQRRPVPARKPGPQSFLLGTRLRPIPKHRSRHADLARGSRNHNTQIKR